MGVVGRLLLVLLLALPACVSTPPPKHHHIAPSSTVHHREARPSKPVIRIVRKDDTLYSIGKKFGVDYHLIAKRNHIRYPYRIYLGQRLYIDREAPRRRDATAQKIRRYARARPAPSHAKKGRTSRHQSAYKVKPKRSTIHFIWPVKGVVTSKFGRRGSRMHDGIDIGAKEGTPVHAAASGEVVYADSRLSGYGKLIIIRHSKNIFTAYGHNQRMLVKKGMRVRQGDIIGRVGHTGRSSGPHLHFEIRHGSTPVNPLSYLPRRR